MNKVQDIIDVISFDHFKCTLCGRRKLSEYKSNFCVWTSKPLHIPICSFCMDHLKYPHIDTLDSEIKDHIQQIKR